MPLPVGLVRDETGTVRKDPHRDVQERIDLVFETFFRVRAACRVLRYFNEQQLLLPRRDRFGDISWKPPTVASILFILKNPAYAGAFVYGRSRTTRAPDGKASTKRLPMGKWKICVHDRYPAYISWQTFEKIQTMLEENYATYDRNASRGVPRPGKALLHGIAYCGECGHKMVVEYERGTRYQCNYLHQQYGVPVCQAIPGDPIDDVVVAAFFQALSPLELDAYAQAVAAQTEVDQRLDRAHRQQIERLRYEAALAERQFRRVDPDNRLVAAELEARWEAALQALKAAEQAYAHQGRATPLRPLPLELQATFRAIGQKLPDIWEHVSQPHKKALLRCLIDKVVIHRVARDTIQTRIVWRGGQDTLFHVPVTVGAFADLSGAETMQSLILDLSRQGKTDEAIAEYLTALGYRSPMRPDMVLPSTVKTIRLRHKLFQVRSQSHPRQIPGYLTPTQVTAALGVAPHWVYDRIYNGSIQVDKDAAKRLYLFPDTPRTLELFKQLQAGHLKNLRFSQGYQDA